MKAFYYEIEPYNIQSSGMNLTVFLYPEITATGVYWNGFGQLPIWLAEEIGQQICAREI